MLVRACVLDRTLTPSCLARRFCLRKLRRFHEAAADFALLIDSGHTTARTYSSRAYSLASIGRYPEAISDYTAALALEPGDPCHALFNRGVCRDKAGDHRAAVADFTAAIAASPQGQPANLAAAYFNRAAALDALGDPQAMADYQRALALEG